MATLRTIFLLLILYFYACNGADPLGQFCNDDYEIRGKTQSANIEKLLAQLVPKTVSTGYATASFGAGQDKVYALAQCRGDVSSKDCSSCIRDAAKQIRQLCPYTVDSRIWYDYCFLRYNQEDFIGKVDTVYGIFYANVANVTDPEDFNQKLGNLMDKVKSEAVKPKNAGLGKGKTKLSPFVTLYALTQCTRDLAAIDCAQCVAIAVGSFQDFCDMKKGCRVLYSSCYTRYELYPFFFPLDSSNSSSVEAVTIKGMIHP